MYMAKNAHRPGISTELWTRLEEIKRPGESTEDVVARILRERPAPDHEGGLLEEAAERAGENIRERLELRANGEASIFGQLQERRRDVAQKQLDQLFHEASVDELNELLSSESPALSAELKSLLGGRLTDYDEVVEEARDRAHDELARRGKLKADGGAEQRQATVAVGVGRLEALAGLAIALLVLFGGGGR